MTRDELENRFLASTVGKVFIAIKLVNIGCGIAAILTCKKWLALANFLIHILL